MLLLVARHVLEHRCGRMIAEVVALLGGGVEPVSYTHLRAHETVLDLVCRLLLEKKKKTYNLNCFYILMQRLSGSDAQSHHSTSLQRTTS